MPVFKYKAVSPTGQTIEGTYTAGSKEEVLGMLRQNSSFPVYIQEYIEGTDVKSLGIFNRVKIKDIAIFCRQFYAMMNAGVSIINCLDILRQQTENKRLRAVTTDVYEIVQKGLTLSEAMGKHSDTFPDLLVNMVAAGEASGNLDTIMARMAEHYEKENKIANKVKGAMTYPIVLSLLAVAVVVGLLTFVMPTFVGMFEESGAVLPAPTRFVMGISDGIKSYWYIIAVVVAAVVYAFGRYSKSHGGRKALDTLKFKLPVVKTTTQKVVTSRFARTMSTLLSSGMPLLQALEIVARVVDNKVVEEGIMKARDEVRKGVSLAVPIKKIGVFPPMLISMLKVGEESGAIDDILDKTANFFDDEVEAAMDRLTKMLEPIMIIAMALVVGSIIVAMVLPMFDMVNTVKMQ